MGDRSLLQTGVNEKRVSRIAAYATPSPPFSLPFPFGRACSCEISVAPDSHSCSCCVALLLRVSALRGHVSLVPELPNAFSTMPAHNSQTLRILNPSQLRRCPPSFVLVAVVRRQTSARGALGEAVTASITRPSRSPPV